MRPIDGISVNRNVRVVVDNQAYRIENIEAFKCARHAAAAVLLVRRHDQYSHLVLPLVYVEQ
jgi:hypothetical protein